MTIKQFQETIDNEGISLWDYLTWRRLLPRLTLQDGIYRIDGLTIAEINTRINYFRKRNFFVRFFSKEADYISSWTVLLALHDFITQYIDKAITVSGMPSSQIIKLQQTDPLLQNTIRTLPAGIRKGIVVLKFIGFIQVAEELDSFCGAITRELEYEGTADGFIKPKSIYNKSIPEVEQEVVNYLWWWRPIRFLWNLATRMKNFFMNTGSMNQRKDLLLFVKANDMKEHIDQNKPVAYIEDKYLENPLIDEPTLAEEKSMEATYKRLAVVVRGSEFFAKIKEEGKSPLRSADLWREASSPALIEEVNKAPTMAPASPQP